MSKHKHNPSGETDIKDKSEQSTADEQPVEASTATAENDVIDDIIDSPDREIESLKNLLQEKEEQVEKEKKEYLFLMAEFDNFRKRTLKEKSDLIKTGSESVLKSLLPVVDDFERGLEAMKNSTDAASIKEGMELVYNKFVKFFEQNGVKVMETTGQDFDAEQHEAITAVPVEDPEQKNKIIDTITKGYTLNGKVIRHAKVVVGN